MTMAADRYEQLVADIYAAKDRYSYYLLAIAAAAIAFAATRTNGVPLQEDHYVLGIAVLFWGLSFYFGCKNRALHIAYLENHLLRTA